MLATTGLLAMGPAARAQTAPPGDVPDPSWSTSDQGQFAGAIPPGFGRTRAPFVEPRIETSSVTRPVAPGVTLRSFDRYGPDAYAGTPTWLQADSLTVDLTKGTKVGYLFPGRVAAGEPISVQANRAGAVAAVNGDFFDINNSTAPLGAGIQTGTLIQSRDITDATWHSSVATVSLEGTGSIGEVFFEGTVVLPGAATVPLAGVNKPTLSVDGIEAFTPLWGTYCRCRPVREAARVTEVEVVGETVTAVRPQAGEGEVPAGGFVLVGREAGADRLAALRPGDPVRIDYRARTPADTRIQAAVSGRQLLVVNGTVQEGSEANNIPPAPRTAVGFSRDGRTMVLLTADGRQPAFSTGLGLNELAQMMVELGAHNALNLDGGGSTTIVARTPGSRTALVENVPSDGRERRDPNGLALFAPEGSGRLRGLWMETMLDPARASGSSRIAPARTERVFPGFTRRLTAAGYDETYGPAAASPRWRCGCLAYGVVDRDGIFHARAPGPVTVHAYDGTVEGSIDLAVLQPLVRLSTSTGRIALGGGGQTAAFGVIGHDRSGNAAPFEPDEISLSYDQELVAITPDGAGQWTVTARGPSGSTLVTVRAGPAEVTLPVTVGPDAQLGDGLGNASPSNTGERASADVPDMDDPLVVQDSSVSSMAWRFAVMSDAQLTASDPEGSAVRNARRTLREIRAAKPDFLLIDGDLVAEGSPENVELARRVLDEELDGAVPSFYVPGDHERSSGSLDTFRAAFGDTQRVFDHKGTRFISFDTSGLSIRSSDWTQLRTLRAELAKAASDPSIGSVILVQHVPPRAPTPAEGRELSDRKEAFVIESWLAELRRSSGKGAALIGAHAGMFHAGRVDGVAQFVNGSSGGDPSVPLGGPGEGSFTGWSLWGVDPVSERQAGRVRANPWLDGPRWLAAEVRPHVDALELSVPAAVRVGTPANVSAVVVQGPRRVPVAYPVTADWSGSRNLHVGGPSGLRPRHAAWLDPSTGRLTALRPGQVQLAVTVNGVTSQAVVRLEAGGPRWAQR